MKAKLGIAPIAWWNDDQAELSDEGEGSLGLETIVKALTAKRYGVQA